MSHPRMKTCLAAALGGLLWGSAGVAAEAGGTAPGVGGAGPSAGPAPFVDPWAGEAAARPSGAAPMGMPFGDPWGAAGRPAGATGAAGPGAAPFPFSPGGPSFGPPGMPMGQTPGVGGGPAFGPMPGFPGGAGGGPGSLPGMGSAPGSFPGGGSGPFGPMGPFGAAPGIGGPGADPLAAFQALDLSEPQRERLGRLADELRKKQWEIQGKVMDRESELRRLGEEQRKAIKALQDLQGQLGQLVTDAVKRASEVLTEEQRQRLQGPSPGMGLPATPAGFGMPQGGGQGPQGTPSMGRPIAPPYGSTGPGPGTGRRAGSGSGGGMGSR
ncbi:MAG: Spy/CpxP family protein refolding chaperone [Gammaproteobacteria bacterium]|nr:Spy/CpxP family protein refolding chaperone [Gammaproteobacteria bacterium]